MLLNARDYPSLQAAIDATDDGDRLYVPAGVWSAPTTGPWLIRRSIELFGDGPGTPDAVDGTVLMPGSANSTLDVLRIDPESPGNQIDRVVIRALKIRHRPGDSYGGRSAIRCQLSSGQQVGSIVLDRIVVLKMGGGSPDPVASANAFHFEGYDSSSSFIDSVTMTDCYASFCRGYGAFLKNVLRSRLVVVGGGGHREGGLSCESSAVALYDTGFEDNGDAAVLSPNRSFLFINCPIAHVEACRFEKFKNSTVANIGCEMRDCRGAAVIASCVFAQPGTPSVGVLLASGGPVSLLPNSFTRVQPTLVQIDSGVTDCVVLPQYNNPQGGTGFPGSISVATSARAGLVAEPVVDRPGVDDNAGLLFAPSSGTVPPLFQDGAIYYNTQSDELRTRINNQPRIISLLP